jgi:hypothetical protein
MFGNKVKILSRLVHRLVTVTLNADKPHTFTDDGYTHRIALIVDSWQEAGAWWLDEPSHTIYTVMTTHEFVYDIERVSGDWFLYRVWD